MPTACSANLEPASPDPQRDEAASNGDGVTAHVTPQTNQPQADDELNTLKITKITGDLTVDPPDNSIVIHSVNCLGEWGSGVALALKNALPGAYKVYKDYCKDTPPEILLGINWLIAPQEGDYDLTPAADGSPTKPRIWVYCLFVSEGYGRRTKTKAGKSRPANIIRHTRQALKGVASTLFHGRKGEKVDWGEGLGREDGPDCDVVWTCKFNSGSFGIKWETTLKLMEEILTAEMWEGELRVVSHR
jgi:ADP-ribose 1''-phosphate phosphatase